MNSNTHVSFQSLINFLFSKWLKIVIVSLLFAIAGFVYKQIKGPTYKATLTFVSEQDGADKMNAYAGIAAQFGIDLGNASAGGVFEGDNLLELFRSKKLIFATLLTPMQDDNSDVLFIDAYIKNHHINLKEVVAANTLFKSANIPERTKDSLLQRVYKNIVQTQLRLEKKNTKTALIHLEFLDNNEVFALQFATQLCKNALAFYESYKTKKASESLAFLQHQADSLRYLLNSSIRREAQVSDLNINPNRQSLRVEGIQSRIDVTANAQLYEEVLKQLALAKITLLRDKPLIQIIDTPVLPLEKVGLGRLFTALLFATVGMIVSLLFFALQFRKQFLQ